MSDPAAAAELLRTVLMIGRNLERQARTLKQVARQLEQQLDLAINAQPEGEAQHDDRPERRVAA